MQGLILAAGRGSRLSSRTNGTPKCLIELDRRPLMEHQLEMLSAAGVGPVHAVVGYCAEEVRERIGLAASYVVNPVWASTNSLYSFWLARDAVRGPLVILNSDVVIDPGILDRVLSAGPDAIAYDPASGRGKEAMKVRVEGGLLADMGKDLPAESVSGENVGLLLLSEEGARRLFEIAEERVARGETGAWLGAAVRDLARERPIRCVDVSGLPWGEIDFPYDLERVRREVWPRIRAARSPARRMARAGARLLPALLLAVGLTAGFGPWRGGEDLFWETSDLPDLEQVRIEAEGRSEGWQHVPAGSPVVIPLEDANRVRVEARDLAPGVGGQGSAARCLFAVELAGQEELRWREVPKDPSGRWTLGGAPVGKSARVELDVPSGARSLKVRLVSVDGRAACLLRVRQLRREAPDGPQ